eukprot:IDg20885t1
MYLFGEEAYVPDKVRGVFRVPHLRTKIKRAAAHQPNTARRSRDMIPM